MDIDAVASPRLQQALPDLAHWVAWFRDAEIPVLPGTALVLEELRANEDEVDANLIGESVAGDPLMTLKVMAYAAKHRPHRLITDAETVTAALVLMGIGPFFRAFGPQRTIDEHLADVPQALDGLHGVLRRAERAAHFALGFAVHRMDPDAAVVHQAALLHDLAEMLLWCHAPTLALQIRERQEADPTLRSKVVQSELLHVHLPDLQQALMKAWRLPELLIRITDDRHAEHPSVRSVVLAIRLARHTARGWDNAAVPDDVRDIGALLNLGIAPTHKLLLELDS
jgi:HD-like signal output (HDOD) protein